MKRSVLVLSVVLVSACSNSPKAVNFSAPGGGGAGQSGGAVPGITGGASATGGVFGSGGVAGSGGGTNTGGAPGTGALLSSGGTSLTRGVASGGAPATGGAGTSGGVGATGGASGGMSVSRGTGGASTGGDTDPMVDPPAAGDETMLIVKLAFEDDLQDGSGNLNHATSQTSLSYTAGPNGGRALRLDGLDDFVQLPPTVANHGALTVAAWVYWNGGDSWQRVFDFGNDESQNMFLTPNSGDGTLRFAIKDGGPEEILDAPVLDTDLWHHVAVTLGAAGGVLYVDGVQVAASGTLTLRPSAFTPALNYIGRSQYPDPLFNGAIDDFRVYSYALSAAEVATLATGN